MRFVQFYLPCKPALIGLYQAGKSQVEETEIKRKLKNIIWKNEHDYSISGTS